MAKPRDYAKEYKRRKLRKALKLKPREKLVPNRRKKTKAADKRKRKIVEQLELEEVTDQSEFIEAMKDSGLTAHEAYMLWFGY